ncbi:MAG: ABC transporter permease [Synergistaceae bacterium]|jgi:simple sugar transport system permease protein|nr:ABC transporter permease [Synergistaceae bacterium]
MSGRKSADFVIRNFFSPDVGISVARYVISFLGVLLLGSFMISLQGEDPVNAARLIMKGAFGNRVSIGNSLRWAIPCMLTGSASIIAFKSGVINLGIEGQMYVGAFVAAVLGWAFKLPPALHVTLCIAASGAAGIAWVIIPALLRLFFRLNEYVTTMMMNFIGTLICDYFVVWVILPGVAITTTTAATPTINKSARLATLIKGTSCSTGFLIGVAACVLVYILYRFTVKGYELKQVGENIKFARTGGVNVKKTFAAIFILSGMLGGLSGGIEVCGGYYKYVSGFSYTMGWEGIMIANICNNHPIGLIFVSIVWGALKTGAMSMERGTSLNRLTVNLLQMLFVILVSVNYEAIYGYFRNRAKKARDMERFLAERKES